MDLETAWRHKSEGLQDEINACMQNFYFKGRIYKVYLIYWGIYKSHVGWIFYYSDVEIKIQALLASSATQMY